MKGVMAICGFLGFLCAVGFALDCPPCNPERCPKFNPKNCKVGVTKDVCHCCSACYKDVGEDCGGPWDIYGTCAAHYLTCVKPLSPSGGVDPIHEFNAKGKCEDRVPLKCSSVCNLNYCPPEFNPENCSVGITRDACNCCPACFKDVGEECGGPWNLDGVCAHHLICVKRIPPSDEPDHYLYFNARERCE